MLQGLKGIAIPEVQARKPANRERADDERDYSEYPFRYSRVRNRFAASLLVTLMLAAS
jgi:hypothetical protein